MTITISAGDSRYDVLVGSGLLGSIGEKCRALFRGPKCALIADTNTVALFAETLLRSLSAAGFTPSLVTIPSGEKSKSLEQIGAICDEMETAGLDRTSLAVALGGGVVGDAAGFAASIYRRGIPVVQVPTTLLAQVDSSIGGKTAVNTRAGKNLLGTFHQPALVIADVDTLKTLPSREFNQGFAEIIKHAIIAEAAMFDVLEKREGLDLAELVARNIKIKAAVVARDTRDLSGDRASLNFGHTVGHAIELAAGYGQLLHGEAVSLGIVAACEISVRKAGLPEGARQQVVAALKRFDLPTKLPEGFPRDRILSAMKSDKKFERGEVRFVVATKLGSSRLTSDVTMEDIAAAVAAL